MDLIAALSSQLGLQPDRAQGLAGAVLGALEGQIGDKLGGADVAALRDGVPELEDWKAKAASLAGGGGALGGSALGGSALGGSGLGGGLGGLLGAAGGLLGGGGGAGGFDLATLVPLVAKLGLGPDTLQKLLPLVLSFLQSRLDPGLISKILSAVPALSQLAGGGKASGGGGLLGALGGIL